MWIVKYRKLFYTLSGLMIAVSFGAIAFYGLNFGIEFKGGSIVEVKYPSGRPDNDTLHTELDKMGISGYSLREAGETNYILRTPHLSEEDRQKTLYALSRENTLSVEQVRFDSVGPTLGDEIKTKSLASIAIVLLAIVLFIAFVFRKVSEPVSSWKYGLIAVIALLHDVIVPTGIFAILGHFQGVEIDSLFVTALLVILGFSVHDTIVVFDRVRENLRRNQEFNKKESFDEVVGRSLSQTFARSINTSLTTLLTLAALYIFGSEATRYFALALLVGITTGTYSSIFIGSPLLVTLEKWQKAGK